MTMLRVGNWKKNNGFTLIELLVVIAIVAVMMGLTVGVFGTSDQALLKKESARLVATIRYAYHQAITRSVIHRLVFDFQENNYWLESGGDTFLLEKQDEKDSKNKKSEKKSKSKLKKSIEEDAALESESEEGPSDEEALRSSFSMEDAVIKKRKLPETLRFQDIFVAHQEKPVSEGQAYLYFFPGGFSEQALIHLSNQDGEQPYSLIVNPLSGNTRVETNYVEVETVFENEEE